MVALDDVPLRDRRGRRYPHAHAPILYNLPAVEAAAPKSGHRVRDARHFAAGSGARPWQADGRVPQADLADRQRAAAEYRARRAADARWLHVDGDREWAGPLRRRRVPDVRYGEYAGDAQQSCGRSF